MCTHTHTHTSAPDLWVMILSLFSAIKVPQCNINGCFSIVAWKDLVINHPLESNPFSFGEMTCRHFIVTAWFFFFFFYLRQRICLMTDWEKCTQPAVVLCWTLICVRNVSSQNQGLSVFIAAAAAATAAAATHSVKLRFENTRSILACWSKWSEGKGHSHIQKWNQHSSSTLRPVFSIHKSINPYMAACQNC